MGRLPSVAGAPPSLSDSYREALEHAAAGGGDRQRVATRAQRATCGQLQPPAAVAQPGGGAAAEHAAVTAERRPHEVGLGLDPHGADDRVRRAVLVLATAIADD